MMEHINEINGPYVMVPVFLVVLILSIIQFVKTVRFIIRQAISAKVSYGKILFWSAAMGASLACIIGYALMIPYWE